MSTRDVLCQLKSEMHKNLKLQSVVSHFLVNILEWSVFWRSTIPTLFGWRISTKCGCRIYVWQYLKVLIDLKLDQVFAEEFGTSFRATSSMILFILFNLSIRVV